MFVDNWIDDKIDKIYNDIEKQTCENCITDYKSCLIFQGANSNICLNHKGFSCSLHERKPNESKIPKPMQ